MSSYAVERNLPIFKSENVIKQHDNFFIKAKVGSDNFLGVMLATPRKEYFAYIDSHNDKKGPFKLGKIEYTKVSKLKLDEGDIILIEVIPNKNNGVASYSEFVPSYSPYSLKFTNRMPKLSFSDWLSFI